MVRRSHLQGNLPSYLGQPILLLHLLLIFLSSELNFNFTSNNLIMRIRIPLLSLLTTGAIALPNHLESKRQFSYNIAFSYDGPLGPAKAW